SSRFAPTAVAAALAAFSAGCGGGSSSTTAAGLPQLAPAQSAALSGSCTDLATKITYADTTITSATAVAAGTVGGIPAPAHCLVTGKMAQRVGPIDGQSYAIGFEMRLPLNWNGRFFYQANGGTDGAVVAATGPAGGGGPLTGALSQGFAVISSD